MKTAEELTGYDKAAIIYDILGDSVAINMFMEISEAELYELRKHANKIIHTFFSPVIKRFNNNFSI